MSKYNRNNPPLFSEAECGLQSGSFVELAAAPDPDALCVSLPGMGQSLVLTERRVFNDQETAIGAGGPAEEGQMEDIFLTSTMWASVDSQTWLHIAHNLVDVSREPLAPEICRGHTRCTEIDETIICFVASVLTCLGIDARRLPFPSAIRLSYRAEDFGMMDYVVVIDKVYYVFRINSVFYNVIPHFRS